MSIGDAQLDERDLPEALTSYQAALAAIGELPESDRGDIRWQRNLSLSYASIGGVQTAQGNLTDALISFKLSLAIAGRLAASDPGDDYLQRNINFNDVEDLSDQLLRAGEFAVFSPTDAHAPGLQTNGPVAVRKVVIKVRV